MFLSRISIAVLACLLGALRLLAAEPQSLSAWPVDSLVKVFPSDAPGTHRLPVAEFWGARNQHVSFQLAVRSAQPRSALTAQVAPLKDSAGHAISTVSIQQVGYVVVGFNTPDVPAEELVGEAPGWYPDVLLPLPVDLKKNRTHSLWVNVHIPNNAVPGLYRGGVAVQSGKQTLTRIPFRLKVVSATVPEGRSLKVTNWFGLDDKLSRQFYKTPVLSEEWWKLVENVGRVMAEHRQNVILTPLLDLVEAQAENGEVCYDFTNFDRWVETFKKAGAIGFIEGSHLLNRSSYDAPLEVTTMVLEGGRIQKPALPPDDPRVEPFLTGFLRALNAHLEEKGWKSIYFQHVLDEAHGSEPPYYGKVAELVHRYLPGVPTLDAVDAAEMPEILQQNCDVWVPQLGRFDQQMELLRQRIRSGHEVWFYTCLFPRGRYMNRLMDYPLIKVRLLHWLNFRYNFTGFLHWGGNYWTPDPIRDTAPVINNNQELLPSGDAFIYYPDPANKSLLSSLRMESMREGIEDYELLRALKAQDPGEAERIVTAAVSSLTDYVRDPVAFRRIQQRLLEALSK
jgi:hypothetical protein